VLGRATQTAATLDHASRDLCGPNVCDKLVIAKLDRLSRNLACIAALMDSGVEFVAVDNPHANKLTVHILAAVAQHERELIAQRTRDALQAAKARGKKLGNPKLGARANAPLRATRRLRPTMRRTCCR
jgi:DNA invertase Pin-like site-specific DNA recombinase